MIIGLVNSLELTPMAESMKQTEEEDVSNIKTIYSEKMRRQSTG